MARSPEYRWRLWRFRGWLEEGFLPMRNVSFDWKLNDIGTLQGSLGLQRGLPPIRPGEHCIIVERNEEPIWMGPIWAAEFDTGTAYLQIRASEWASYLRRRRIRWDDGQDPETPGMTFRGWDQFDIARELIRWTQADHGGQGDLHIDRFAGREEQSRTLSGVTRDRNYKAVDRKEIWEAMTQLGDVINGFDQRLRPMYGFGGVPVIWWEGFYPRQGQSQERHGVVLEYREGWPGSNVINYRWPWKADELLNVAEAANEETVAWATYPAAWDRYPVLEGIAQKGGEGGVTSEETLQQHADQLLADNSRTAATGTLELAPGSLAELGPDLIGSEVRVRLTSWRHPAGPDGQPGWDDLMRIVSIGINAPSDERAESATIECAPIFWESW